MRSAERLYAHHPPVPQPANARCLFAGAFPSASSSPAAATAAAAAASPRCAVDTCSLWLHAIGSSAPASAAAPKPGSPAAAAAAMLLACTGGALPVVSCGLAGRCRLRAAARQWAQSGQSWGLSKNQESRVCPAHARQWSGHSASRTGRHACLRAPTSPGKPARLRGPFVAHAHDACAPDAVTVDLRGLTTSASGSAVSRQAEKAACREDSSESDRGDGGTTCAKRRPLPPYTGNACRHWPAARAAGLTRRACPTPRCPAEVRPSPALPARSAASPLGCRRGAPDRGAPAATTGQCLAGGWVGGWAVQAAGRQAGAADPSPALPGSPSGEWVLCLRHCEAMPPRAAACIQHGLRPSGAPAE